MSGSPSGPESIDLIETYRRHLSRGRALFGQVSGGLTEVGSEGAWVSTADGRRLLDCGGYGVFLHGHRHPRVVAAVAEQLHRHPLATRVLLEPVTAAAAATLASISPAGLPHVHFVNSGAEATETALKLARALGHRTVIATHGGFHGKTLGALSATGNPTYQDPFRPLLLAVHVPYGDLAAITEAIAARGADGCVLIEPIQGEAGVVLPPPGYLTGVAEACRRHGALLVVDEIQTGLGRTGRWWGGDHDGVTPDVVLVGKGLSGGVVPVAAVLASRQAYAPFDADPFLHSSTFAGSPLACAAARAAVETIAAEGLHERAREIGDRLREAIGGVLVDRLGGAVLEVRGRGLLIGAELAQPGLVGELVLELLHEGVVVSTSLNEHRVLRFTPPAILTKSEETSAIAAVDRAARNVAARLRPAPTHLPPLPAPPELTTTAPPELTTTGGHR
ncbi:MAG: aminotransferase class III-fold pyridoxal phosphate-dependent enzyme [Microlunatus sp.]|nr:aminotransferase class III-fold pyridoxal phosphate-dependent enzyme [Microlunatus sp.]MDN5770844.1 aminotransferase class III-fold pyridoxal phosphate-dependent enzyme [Microlunatus sp.]